MGRFLRQLRIKKTTNTFVLVVSANLVLKRGLVALLADSRESWLQRQAQYR